MTAHVFRSVDSTGSQFLPCALAIGNFDGVHAGHIELLKQTVAQAAENDVVPSVLTFDPHPTSVVAPHRQPQMLCSLGERISLLELAGIRQILVLPFTSDVARMSPREFVSKILAKSLQTRAVFVGENFRFGNRQAGNSETLKALGAEFGFEPHFLPPVVVRGQVVSSSVIRGYVVAGAVSRAARLLGRCFSLSGPIVSGHGVGSKQTVPTLNVKPVAGLVCPRGVFVTETFEAANARRWRSITNVGVRPTFGGDELTIETFLLSPLEGPAPEYIEVRFRRFIRAERQFPSPESLKAQIFHDVGRAQSYWRRIASLKEPPARIY